MAQDEVPESSSPSSAAAGRLNAAAPEFTPRSAAPHQAHPHRRGPHHHHHHHHHQPHHQHQHQYRHQHHHQGEDEGDAAAVVDNAQLVLPEELARRVVKQVEFYFSDVNLATTDHLMKYITKDPDGFVPMTVVASFRKIRELIDRSLLPGALRTSTELVSISTKSSYLPVYTFLLDMHILSAIDSASNLLAYTLYCCLIKICAS
uniref:HTH La-type RNA-binding domain-containing protein n=1 Tax=Triticum urartu TaxID=4572 RepID=A0A8R7R296_TRIUA